MIEMESKEAKKAAQKRWYQKYGKEWYKNYREKHREELITKNREYYQKHRKELQEKARQKRLKIRLEVIKYYGGKCICCGEDCMEFLTIDHIKGEGRKHRRSLGGANRFYNWLRKNNFPKGFQVLCMNCNWGKRMNNGVCPHVRKRQAEN